MRHGWVFGVVLAARLVAQDQAGGALLDGIDARTEQYADYDSFSASVVFTMQEMNKRWKPEKIVTVQKRIQQDGEERREVILYATEASRGSEKDVTEEYRDEERKRQERAAKRRKRKEEDGGDGSGFSLSLEDVFPFSAENRDLFTFRQLADTLASGCGVFRIHVEAREPSDKLFNGEYWIDRETLDVVMIDVVPSKNPRFVKALRMKMWFDVRPGDYFVMTKYWMHVDAGFLFKKVRMEVEEVYTDYRISESP